MLLTGHIENGTVVFDTPLALADGTPVEVAVAPTAVIGDWQRTLTAEEWIARMQAFAASQPRVDWFVDDSRESIYGDNGR